MWISYTQQLYTKRLGAEMNQAGLLELRFASLLHACFILLTQYTDTDTDTRGGGKVPGPSVCNKP